MTNVNESAVAKQVVGVENAEKVSFYTEVAEFLADKFGITVYRVKPGKTEGQTKDGKPKIKATGGYGLVFEHPDMGLMQMEAVIKAKATLEDYVIAATTEPDA